MSSSCILNHTVTSWLLSDTRQHGLYKEENWRGHIFSSSPALILPASRTFNSDCRVNQTETQQRVETSSLPQHCGHQTLGTDSPVGEKTSVNHRQSCVFVFIISAGSVGTSLIRYSDPGPSEIHQLLSHISCTAPADWYSGNSLPNCHFL